MARRVKDRDLGSRSARRKLDVQPEPYWRELSQGIHLGYRRRKDDGTWVVRVRGDNGRYRETKIGLSDDTLDANGTTILSFPMAQERAAALYRERTGPQPDAPPYAVADACRDYVAYLKAERRTGADAEWRLNRSVVPKLGDKMVGDLTADQLEDWKRGLVRRAADDPDMERRSKDTANRLLKYFRAALNRAYATRQPGVTTDIEWRHVRPFRRVARSRQVHLDRDQLLRLVNAAASQGEAFRRLVVAAMLTGARPPGEMADLRVSDFHRDLGTLAVRGKTGSREVALSSEAVEFFAGTAAGKNPDDLLLPKDDGSRWGRGHHMKLMREAVKRARLPKGTSIYTIRHSYISQSLLNNINLKLLAENCGTSVALIEKTYGKFMLASKRKLIEESAFKLGLPKPKVVALQRTKR